MTEAARPHRRAGALATVAAALTLIAATALTGAPAPLAVAAASPGAAATPATAGWGAVLVPGAAWAPQWAARGDLNVYSNGSGGQDQAGPYGPRFECVELAQRFAAVAFGEQALWPISTAAQMWGAGPHVAVPFVQHPNGGADGPQAGDILVQGPGGWSPVGHAAVVAGTGPGYVDIVEQNWGGGGGRARLPISGTTMPARSGSPVLGWLRNVRAVTAPPPPVWPVAPLSAIPRPAPVQDVAVVTTDGQMQVLGPGGLQPLGGHFIAAPAAVAEPSTRSVVLPGALETGTADDGRIWVRDAGHPWQPLSDGMHCTGGPAAVVTGTPWGYRLTVGCRSSADGALWVASGPLAPGSLPAVAAWTSLGGHLAAGPALTAPGGVVTAAAVDAAGALSIRTLTGPWQRVLAGTACAGRPALAASGAATWVACRRAGDGALVTARGGAAGFGAAQVASLSTTDGPGLAAQGSAVTVHVRGSDGHLRHATLTAAGAAGTFVDDGVTVAYGASAVTLAAPPVAVGLVQNGGPGDGSMARLDSPGTFVGAGGSLLDAPAVVTVPAPDGTGAGTPLYLGVGTDHAVWVTTATSGWRVLTPSGLPYCSGNPAAAVTGPPDASVLTVGCTGRDGALWVTSGAVTAGSPPVLGGWWSLGGGLSAGPAAAPVGGLPTFVVTGTDHTVWTRTLTTGWRLVVGPRCSGHPAVGSGASRDYLACRGLDGSLWYLTGSGGAWGAVQPAGGTLLGGPGLAALGGEAVVEAVGGDGALWETAVNAAGAGAWTRLGWSARFGAAAAALDPAA